jgi:hypothetical protein
MHCRAARRGTFTPTAKAVVLGLDGIADFNALHSRRHDEVVQLYAFDILVLDGDDLRSLPLSMRKTNLARQPLKKLDADEESLLKLLHRWRKEAEQAGHPIKRVVVAYEAGRDGFWLARWLRTRGVEAYVIHPNSIAVSREHRRAKTDRLDTELLLRALLGWLRGEKRHCSMVAIPTIEEEDALGKAVLTSPTLVVAMNLAGGRLSVRGASTRDPRIDGCDWIESDRRRRLASASERENGNASRRSGS